MTKIFAQGKFINTPTSRLIAGFVEKVRRSGRCGWVKGESGIGKTSVIRHLVAQPDSFTKVITTLKPQGSLKPFLATLGQVVGCNAIGNSAKAIYDKLEDFLTPDQWGDYHQDLSCTLLLIDEAQHIDLETMRVVLELQKNSGIPMVFFSNEERLQKTRLHDPSLKQIANRLPFRINIESIRTGDVQAFAIAYGVEGVSAYHYLDRFGLMRHLHDVTFILDEARILAGPQGPIQLQHLREAVTLWRGEDQDRQLFKLVPKPRKEENAA